MRCVTLNRESTILMFDGDSINPSSSLQIMKVGDRGMIHSLIGEGFYKMLNTVGLSPFLELGIAYLYAAVSKSHYRLMSRNLPDDVHVERQGTCMIEGHEFVWVMLTNKEKNVEN